MANQQHVLVVDGPAETETVLRAVMNPKGVAVTRVRSGMADRSCDQTSAEPNLVVLHDQEQMDGWPGVPRVFIGKATVSIGGSRSCCLDGPFEYPELVAAIDRLLTE